MRSTQYGGGRVTFVFRSRFPDSRLLIKKTAYQNSFLVSGPELTLVDLVKYPVHAAGWDNIATIESDFGKSAKEKHLRIALEPEETTVLQRLGWLLDHLGFNKLSDASPADPGNLVGPADSAEKCPIEVTIEYEGAKEGLGLAGQGAQKGENLVVYNPDSPDSFVDVLLHELGHSMGQTVVSGIYDADKGGVGYGNKGGTCIMFGENSGKDPSSATMGFCPLCLDYIKARNLFDLDILDGAEVELE